MVRGSRRLRDAAGPVANLLVVALLVVAMGPVAAQDEDPRTPSDAMPGHTPVETGEGFAKFEVHGTSDVAVRLIFNFLSDTDPYTLRLHGDETLVESVLTWESELTDLDLCLRNATGVTLRCSNHGMEAQETLNPLPLLTVNGSRAEHLVLDAGALASVGPPTNGSLAVVEGEVWDPMGFLGLVDPAQGVPYLLEVWVYTVPAEATHSPFEPEPEPEPQPEPQPAGVPGPDQPTRPVGPLGALPI